MSDDTPDIAPAAIEADERGVALIRQCTPDATAWWPVIERIRRAPADTF